MSRLTDLEEMRTDLKSRMAACTSDQNFAVMARLLVDVVKQLEELSGPSEKPKETGLSDFEKRLRERESSAKNPRSAGRV